MPRQFSEKRQALPLANSGEQVSDELGRKEHPASEIDWDALVGEERTRRYLRVVVVPCGPRCIRPNIRDVVKFGI